MNGQTELHMEVLCQSLDDLEEEVERRLRRFAPKAKFSWRADVREVALHSATGYVETVHYEASVVARPAAEPT